MACSAAKRKAAASVPGSVPQGYPPYGAYGYGGWPGYTGGPGGYPHAHAIATAAAQPQDNVGEKNTAENVGSATLDGEAGVAAPAASAISLQRALSPPTVPTAQAGSLGAENESSLSRISTTTTSEGHSAPDMAEIDPALRPIQDSASASIALSSTGDESDSNEEKNDEDEMDVDDNEEDDNGEDSSENDSPCKGKEKGKAGRKGKSDRICAGNAAHGYVAGVKKGNADIDIFRRKPLPKMHPKPGSRFNKVMPDIIARCERLAQETGCYLMIAAANRGASSAPFHWVSSAIRQEARTEAAEILNIFQTTVGAIKRARQAEAVALMKGLIKMEAEKAELEISEGKARLALAESTTQVALQARIIAELQEKLSGRSTDGAVPGEADTSA
ncbi:hypothetical protein B0H17DRAFT_1200822 [Mycena rosella]|uniref:Uncharacterized protein n=1 Tax=Mycena rosella TaxID=1033263 RepID=A0AAD7DJ01_MYCRO|nr:hypothetical protein B0H17DRAFT_1200822 [Mycena rosella]